MRKALYWTGALALLLVSATASAQFGDVAAGKQKAQVCAACHGAHGNGTADMYPRLAGQYANYIYRQLKDFKSGRRKNAIMNGMASSLSDQDMRNLAAYFSQLPNGLTTPPRW